MKIKYGKPKLNIIGVKELVDIATNKDRYIKNKKPISLLIIVLVTFLFTILLTSVLILSNVKTEKILDIDYFLLMFIYIVLLIYIGQIIFMYFKCKKATKGELEITNDYIEDSFDGVSIKLDKDIIKSIVIGKNSIVILSSFEMFLFVSIEYKDKIIKALESKMKDVNIIYKSTK